MDISAHARQGQALCPCTHVIGRGITSDDAAFFELTKGQTAVLRLEGYIRLSRMEPVRRNLH